MTNQKVLVRMKIGVKENPPKKLQRFYYIVEKGSRSGGGRNMKISVYVCEKNDMKYVGKTNANTAAWMGEKGEAWAVVLKSGKLKKSVMTAIKRMEKSGHCYNIEDCGAKIEELS